jgi:hypothetical protein
VDGGSTDGGVFYDGVGIGALHSLVPAKEMEKTRNGAWRGDGKPVWTEGAPAAASSTAGLAVGPYTRLSLRRR